MSPSALPAVRVRMERSGRGGKTVTLVEGLRLPPDGLAALLRSLKTRLGVGGTVHAGALEIQGDQRERLCALLAALGHPARRAN